MKHHIKEVGELCLADMATSSVWEFILGDEVRLGETHVAPVLDIPVDSLENRVIGTTVALSNGATLWGLLGNVDVHNVRRTRHFLTLSIRTDTRWFHLARYHDADYERRGPKQFASFLGLAVDQVFPIRYDISSYVLGSDECIRGCIQASPSETLSEEELMKLAMDSG